MRSLLTVTMTLALSIGVLGSGPVSSAQASMPKPRAVKVGHVTKTSVALRWRAPKIVAPGGYAILKGSKRLKSTKQSKATVKKLRCGRRYRLRVASVGAQKQLLGRSKTVTAKTSSCVSASAANFDFGALARLLSQDMTLPSETRPHGLSTDFAANPRLSAGSNAGGYSAFTAWGQLYECAGGNPAPSAQVQITSMEAWIKSRTTGQWSRLQGSNTTGGGAYVESYANDTSKPADAVVASGTTLARAGGGYNYHFWPEGTRPSINPADVADVITTVRARLLPGSYSSPAPCYVLSSGADYWTSPGAAWDNLKTNTDVGIGRFKRVQADWRVFTMSTTATGTLPRIAGSNGELR